MISRIYVHAGSLALRQNKVDWRSGPLDLSLEGFLDLETRHTALAKLGSDKGLGFTRQSNTASRRGGKEKDKMRLARDMQCSNVLDTI